MTIHKIKDIGILEIISDDIVLWCANDGIEIDMYKFQSLLKEINRLYPSGAKLIIDRRHRYSVTFDVMFIKPRVQEIIAMAFIVYTRLGMINAEMQMRISKSISKKPVRIFNSDQGIESAVTWLKDQQP
ncbi:MAG: hypothetical protein ABW085_12055 [Sedimenticola sp.]